MSGGGGGGCPMWVLTYADMITVLMGFFVIMSTLAKPEKKDEVAAELVQQFGSPDAVERFAISVKKRRVEQERKSKDKHPPPGRQGYDKRVMSVREGNRLGVGAPTYFPAGSAELTEETKNALTDIAQQLRGKLHIVAVRAYQPRRDPTARDLAHEAITLASTRAEAVAHFLIEHGRLNDDLIRIEIGAPVESLGLVNPMAVMHSKDRVDVMVLEASTPDFESPSGPAAPK